MSSLCRSLKGFVLSAAFNSHAVEIAVINNLICAFWACFGNLTEGKYDVSSNKWSIRTEISQIDKLFYMLKLDFWFFFLINKNLFF